MSNSATSPFQSPDGLSAPSLASLFQGLEDEEERDDDDLLLASRCHKGRLHVMSLEGSEDEENIWYEQLRGSTPALSSGNPGGLSWIHKSIVGVAMKEQDCNALYDPESDSLVHEVPVVSPVSEMCYFERSSLLVTGDESGHVKCWRIQSSVDGTEVSIVTPESLHQPHLESHDYSQIGRLSHHEHAWPSRVLSGSIDSTARMWDLVKEKEIGRMDHLSLEVSGVDVSPGGDLIVTTVEKSIRLWDSRTMMEGSRIQTAEKLCCCAWSRMRVHDVIVGMSGRVSILDVRMVRKMRVEKMVSRHSADVISLCRIDEDRFAYGADFYCSVLGYNGKEVHAWELGGPAVGLCYVPQSSRRDKWWCRVASDERLVYLFSEVLLDALIRFDGIKVIRAPLCLLFRE